MIGQHEYRQLRIICAHITHQLDAIALIEADVGDDRIGVAFFDGDTRVSRGIRLRAYQQVIFIFDNPPQTLANDRMVIDNQNSASSGFGGGYS
jgi:hypothetical protein